MPCGGVLVFVAPFLQATYDTVALHVSAAVLARRLSCVRKLFIAQYIQSRWFDVPGSHRSICGLGFDL